jgi:hypothetical protein
MKRKSPYFVLISTTDFSVRLYSRKQRVADIVGCHRNTLANIKERATIGGYIIIPVYLIK